MPGARPPHAAILRHGHAAAAQRCRWARCVPTKGSCSGKTPLHLPAVVLQGAGHGTLAHISTYSQLTQDVTGLRFRLWGKAGNASSRSNPSALALATVAATKMWASAAAKLVGCQQRLLQRQQKPAPLHHAMVADGPRMQVTISYASCLGPQKMLAFAGLVVLRGTCLLSPVHVVLSANHML